VKTICITHDELEAQPEVDIHFWPESVQTNMFLWKKLAWKVRFAVIPQTATLCDILLCHVHFKGAF